VEADGVSREAFGALRIVGEELAQVKVADTGVVLTECAPGRPLSQ
jgi:hypothetical protein